MTEYSVEELNALTARQRTFKMLHIEIYESDTFSPNDAMKKAIVRALGYTELGVKRFDFDRSKRSGAPAICVYARSRDKCYRCTQFEGRCLHPSGPNVNPFRV